MRILLVEDEKALVDVLARNLRARGYDVTSSGTAESALLEMARAWPDAILLDVNLPDHTGWEILRRLTPIDRDTLGVVIISAGPISPKRIDEFRPDRWLQKPFPIDALMRAIADVTHVTASEGGVRK